MLVKTYNFKQGINMNKLIKYLLVTAFALNSYSLYAATTTENTDDASSLGTSSSPQVQKQTDRTEKGATGVNQGATESDASNLGNADSPQVKKQAERTNKGASEPVKHKHRNKVLKSKDMNHGTTQGNKVQPSEPEQAAPATSAQ